MNPSPIETAVPARRFGLKARLSLGVAAVVLASTLGIAIGALQLVKNGMRTSIAAEVVARVNSFADSIDQKFVSRSVLLQTFADSIEAENFQSGAPIQAFLAKHPSLKLAFDNVAVMDLEGKLIANLNGAQKIGMVNVKDRDYFQRTVATRAGTVSQPYRNRINGLAQVAITEPVFDSTGQLRFVMSGSINLQDQGILGSSAQMKFGSTGYLFVAASDGVLVDHPVKERILHNVREYGSDTAVALRVTTGFEGSVEGIDEGGQPALYAFKHLRQTSWVIGAILPQSEAFAHIDAIERVSGLGALLLGLAAGALALTIVQRQLRPLGELHQHMRLARSSPGLVRESAQPRNYSNDEIGELALTFDQLMAERRHVERSLADSEAQVRTIADNIPALVSRVDAALNYTFVNAPVREANSNALVGKWMPQVRGAADYALLEPYYRRALAGQTCVVEHTGDRSSHLSEHTFKAHYIPDIDAHGVVRGVFAMTFDISDEVQLRRALIQQEKRLRDVTDNMPALVGYFDAALNCLYGNSRARQLAGLGDGQMMEGVTLRSSLGDDLYKQIEPHLAEVMAGRTVQLTVNAPMRGKEGHFQANLVPDRDLQGEVLGFYLMSFNITALKETELRLAESELRLRTITDNMPALISYIDRDEKVTFANATTVAWLGQTPAEVLGRHVADISGQEAYAQRKSMIARALAGERVEFETRTQRLGHERVTQMIYVPDTRADGVTHGIFSLSLDITRLKMVERQLFNFARIDTLTGLQNRLAFNEYLSDAVARGRREGASIAIMFLDVDRFKAINDTLGHAIGDAVLIEYARRLQTSVRGTDLVARLAGDEFVVVLEDIGSHHAVATVAAKIVEQVNALPFLVEGTRIEVSTSIGIAYQRCGDVAISAADLLAHADAALYNAKAAGRNRYAFFFEGHASVSKAIKIESTREPS